MFLLRPTLFHALTISNLTLNLSSCCGMEWMATSPSTQGSAASIICNGTALSSLTPGQTFSGCQCKTQTTKCYAALNYTQQPGPVPNCNMSCPAGYRVYHTGSQLPCTDPLFGVGDQFSLYETACQGMWSALTANWCTCTPTPGPITH